MVKAKASLRINFVLNLISQVLTLLVPLITTPYLARILHETGVGQISYATSIITFFSLFANLGFSAFGQREVARFREDKERKSEAFWEIVILHAIMSALSFGVLMVWLLTIGFGDKYNLLILILGIQVIGNAFDIQYLFQGEEDFKSITARTILLKVIGVACIFIFVKTENDGWIYVLCLSLSTVFANLIMWPSAFRYIGIVKIKNIHLGRNIRPVLLIFLPTLAITIYTVFDKTMIGLLSTNPDYDNGCYEQAYKINSTALLLVTLITPVLTSHNTYDYAHQNKEKFLSHVSFAFNYVLLVGIPLIAGFAVLSPSLSSWFLGEGYDEVPLLMQIMSVRFVISGFGDILCSSIFIATKKEIYPTVSSIIAACINVVLNFLLIPNYGAVGAAIATACCEFVQTAVLLLFAAKYKYIKISSILLMSWKYIVSAGAMFAAIYVLQFYMGYSVWEFLLIMIVGILIYGLMLIIVRDKFALNQAKRLFDIAKSKIFKSKAD